MGTGPDGGPMGPMGPNSMGPVLNGDGMDGMKNSPANGGPGTPREDSGSGMGDYNLSGFGGPGENVSCRKSVEELSICGLFGDVIRAGEGRMTERSLVWTLS